ncbi:MAG: ATP-dependent Clp protease ATP-binding subunit, partial [Nitrospinae bacterium]|nr:ATP-dependent Clp protease ATP-binding subunit [Nitrospinota bacterium]
HTLVGAGAAEGSMDGANIMKPALSRGEIQCIGATTIDEYRRHIEKNGALERRFQSVMVEQPTLEETIKIIRGLREEYEIHHKVTITDEAIEAAVRLSDRYVPDRFLPDKAIDAVDEAASMVHLRLSTYTPEMQELYRKVDEVIIDKVKWIEAQKFERALSLRNEEEELKTKLDLLKNEWRKNQGEVEPTVTEDDIARVISKTTGIPINRIEEEETQKLRNVEMDLAKHIIGQSEAIKVVASAIRRSRAGLKDANRPMGSFLFVGPTGVGKTELTKVLAERLFGDSDSIIRLDMSEYMEKHNASTMIGAPPGYVGFEEGGKLTEKVRRHPYSVVLFDEIDKAHPDIFNILLQIMDEGRLTDSAGRTVSFKNVILIMTSNLGTRSLEKVANMGFQSQDAALSDQKYKGNITAELKKLFNPEFLNRIDEVVIFNHLLREDIRKILSAIVSELSRRLFERGIALELGEPVFDWLVEESYNPAYGARELRRVVQKNISDPIAEAILFQGVKDGKVMIEIGDGRPTISIEKGELAGL